MFVVVFKRQNEKGPVEVRRAVAKTEKIANYHIKQWKEANPDENYALKEQVAELI